MMGKRFKVRTSAGEVMAVVFWGRERILLLESLKRSAEINPK